jgi:PTH1 family peptidyl-tRNA hydrolase
MKLLVGLGNPGEKYRLTRHNIGFLVIEACAKKHNIRLKFNRRFNALTGEGFAGKEARYILMPQTYMNMSGNSVRGALNWLKIKFENILVIVDDVALPFGAIRIRPKGSNGGHKGLLSIAECLATNEFPRMRIGIMGRNNIRNVPAYVLAPFTKAEQKLLPDIIERAAFACECWVGHGIERAMNQFNSKDGG